MARTRSRNRPLQTGCGPARPLSPVRCGALLPLARGIRGRRRIGRHGRVHRRDLRPRGRDRHDGGQQGDENSDEDKALHGEALSFRTSPATPGAAGEPSGPMIDPCRSPNPAGRADAGLRQGSRRSAHARAETGGRRVATPEGLPSYGAAQRTGAGSSSSPMNAPMVTCDRISALPARLRPASARRRQTTARQRYVICLTLGVPQQKYQNSSRSIDHWTAMMCFIALSCRSAPNGTRAVLQRCTIAKAHPDVLSRRTHPV